uniref:PH domain-containing protein n=1 Tax=Emiliania huxleyi TaxID=2903 RepID=A0A7S3T9J1_EMIHU|mmetsp:Transcript_32333/g.96280  ORF Transcript_32333/g.96280 Transcript_32333/m.96280 type:complete len:353 (-) Transcript_32333:210-1268(-)
MRDQPVTDLDAVREELRRLQNLCLDQAAALRARDERIHHLEEHTNAPLAVAYAAAPAAVSRGKQRAHAPLARVSAAAAAAVDAASEESPRNSSEAGSSGTSSGGRRRSLRSLIGGRSRDSSSNGAAARADTRAAVAEAAADATRRLVAERGVSDQQRVAAGGRRRSHRLQPHELQLHGLGWLTKFSKGGYTANWNRRVFALIGSSLFYAKSIDDLVVQPKLFAQLDGRSLAGPWTRSKEPFCLQLTTGRGEVLLLSADSEAEMWEWIERLNRARGHPECEATAVAPLIHYATGPEPLFQEVLLSRADAQGAQPQASSRALEWDAGNALAQSPAEVEEVVGWFPPFIRNIIPR